MNAWIAEWATIVIGLVLTGIVVGVVLERVKRK